MTQKVTTSKSAGALLNDTSNELGNAYVETQKFFNLNQLGLLLTIKVYAKHGIVYEMIYMFQITHFHMFALK